MNQKQFTATTKSGITMTVNAQNTLDGIKTDYPVKQLDNIRYAVVLTPAQAKSVLGITLPATMKEALVMINDVTAWKSFENACLKEQYEMQRAANPLHAQYADLKTALDIAVDNGGHEAFPGSKAYTQYQDALNALTTFNAAHPEIN